MTPERWKKVEELFHAALARDSEMRKLYLADACGDDQDLRASVEAMLKQNTFIDDILNRPAWEALPLSPTATVLTVGAKVGPYKIEDRLGAGGMGVVYRAVDTRLGRHVAIKTLPARYGSRFEREARAIAMLNHPNICTLHDIGPDYLVMELLEGKTLSELIQQGPLDTGEVLQCGTQIAGALAEAHRHGIVHRDLKPANIMVTRNGLKVLDFGLAKITADTGGTVTQPNLIMGTPAYMAPEQVSGKTVGPQADLFALGLVIYEMACGKLPLPGGSLGTTLASGASAAIPPLAKSGVPASKGLDNLVKRLLESAPENRPDSADEVCRELSHLRDSHERHVWPVFSRPTWMIPAAMLVIAGIVGVVWAHKRFENQRWATEEAVPQFQQLMAEEKPLAAFQIIRKARSYLPGDLHLRKIDEDSSKFVSIKSEPAGATVQIQDYLSPDGQWFRLGTTPVEHARIPDGYFRWRISKPEAGDLVTAPPTAATMQFDLRPSPATEAGMVYLDRGRWIEFIDFIGWLRYRLPPFYIDKFEVTNSQYQEFVDKGGYQNRTYWKEPFIRDGKAMGWEEAMDSFRDPTGRPGPATWEAGHFPEGQADYPVSGVSWYEAAAYLAFAGKALPALPQWYKAAPPELARYSINQSNFSASGPIAVGKSQAVGPYGTYDMIGNVREWCLNEAEMGRRFILGGAWRTQTYQALDPEALSPFDRSPMNGFRGVKNLEALPDAAAGPLIRKPRDFSQAKPASDQTFQIYRAMYAYDRRALNPASGGIVENTADWTKEKITIDAGYEGERLPMYLYLPKNVPQPFQATLFFPSARVNFMPSSENLGDLQFVDYIIKSGRALLYPIYKGTYERAGNRPDPGSVEDRALVIEQSKEVRRAVDYLVTRKEIDMTKLGYVGVSQGSAYGVIFAALEDRFKAIVFLDGGFFLGNPAPGRDQVDFAPRLKKPVLMVNGRYDFTFSLDRAQNPFFRMLGTPDTDKRHVVFDTPHDISQRKNDLSKEVLAWFDEYLGRVDQATRR